MSDPGLLNILKTLNYSNDEIHAIMDAAKGVELKNKIQATDLSQLLTVQAAAAQSSRHAAQLRQLDNSIYYASGGTYRLPKHGHVDLMEVSQAIRGASIEARAAIKSGLYELHLIER